MAVVCAQVPLTIGTYTAISSAGQTNVSFILNIGTCRMVIATSQPADNTTAFVHVSAHRRRMAYH
jgi:hypothetical protein